MCIFNCIFPLRLYFCSHWCEKWDDVRFNYFCIFIYIFIIFICYITDFSVLTILHELPYKSIIWHYLLLKLHFNLYLNVLYLNNTVIYLFMFYTLSHKMFIKISKCGLMFCSASWFQFGWFSQFTWSCWLWFCISWFVCCLLLLIL